MSKVNCFIPYSRQENISDLISELKSSALVKNIFLLSTENAEVLETSVIKVADLWSTKTIQEISKYSDTEYSLIITNETKTEFGQFAIERFYNIANDVNAGMVYSDYYEVKENQRSQHPVIDYQSGSLRDDFNFGSVLFYNSTALKEAASRMKGNYSFAGLYDLRLKVSENNPLFRVPEMLYTKVETDLRKSGQKQFDYVDPKNRKVQIEMEEAVTEHLKNIGGYLEPKFDEVKFDEENFEVEASVIIPVKNRAKTVGDAIESVLKQITKFKFNLIVVDNYSDDGTSEIIKGFADKDDRVVHLVPARKDLGIGGCWNEAVHSKYCGKFSVQLDSDDIYADENTIQTVVDAFYEQKCGMVVGTYKMTNFKLEEIPPGIIDHKEWTPDNGRNNALRINGLGAPRAFYTPLLKKIKIPNTSYGEDYAVGLAISRNYQIGRIYHPIYMCRRWEGNSDAALDVAKMNAHNTYKDRIRTIELTARINKNKK
ncbi:MAG: glycosyltransferase family 2 protein [Melioribacteraceae bacterium]|nr:glycosyltransferase family 2 protein [Melioribacteraceae bacterium]